MPHFRKKPILVEAVRFERHHADNGTLVFHVNSTDVVTFLVVCKSDFPGDKSIIIPTLEGFMEAKIGDWIIRGTKGEFYPCKPDIFEATYELCQD